MKAPIILLLILLVFISCKENKTGNYDSEFVEKDQIESYENLDEVGYDEDLHQYADGIYCAEVEYYNPSSGTISNYSLNVEVENGELTVIHWPNSGWLDNSHFSPKDITSGECEFYSDKGYRYKITLGDFGGCGYTDEYKVRQNLENDIEEELCSKCGGEKYSYEEICYQCKRKIEQTCPECGGYKFSSFDELCDDCNGVLENIEEK